MTRESEMLSLLGGELPDPEQVDSLALFGQFVGSWDLDATFIDDEVETRTTGEWHFDWVLHGRALQDVLIFPALASSKIAITSDHRLGTSLRFYDAEAGTWRVVWINPSSNTMYKLTGGQVEDEIILNGDPLDGEPTQWIFSDISESSFDWRGLVSDDDRKTWTLIQKMHARRRK
jgi:hypothetical protein